MEQISVLIADSQRLFRDGIRKILETESDMIVAGEAGDGEEAIALLNEKGPDVLLFDVSMPRAEGIQFIRDLGNCPSKTRYVAVSSLEHDECFPALSASGVLGFVLKSSSKLELLSAIRSAARGQPYVDPKAAARVFSAMSRRRDESDQLCYLTPREKEILYWLSQGLSNAEVADRMVLSEKTVKNHVSHVLKKLDLRDRTQAAILAWRIGFAQLSPDTRDQVLGNGVRQ